MEIPENLPNLGLPQNALKAYLALVDIDKPINGSQLSVKANIPRPRIYDTLRMLKSRGIAIELEPGLYAPLPPEELVKRFRHRFDDEIKLFEKMIQAKNVKAHYDYVWTISDYEEVMSKAREMITNAQSEVYIRVMPEEGTVLEEDLIKARDRGVTIKFIVLGVMPMRFEYQVEHHLSDKIHDSFGGRAFDIVVDKEEILVGVLDKQRKNRSPINWTKNRSFVISARENLRHDYFHIFLYKIHEKGQLLSEREKKIYDLIKDDY